MSYKFFPFLLLSAFALISFPLVAKSSACTDRCDAIMDNCFGPQLECQQEAELCLNACENPAPAQGGAGAGAAAQQAAKPQPAPQALCSCTIRVSGPNNCDLKTTVTYKGTDTASFGQMFGQIGFNANPNCAGGQNAFTSNISADVRGKNLSMAADKCDGNDKTFEAEGFTYDFRCFRGSAEETGPALDPRDRPEGYETGARTGIAGILPRCAFYASGCDGANANIDLFIEIGINIAKVIFSIIGTVAFAMFVYGGFTMILSFGSGDKFKKGQDILVAAVIGMIISFSAYLLVNFVLNALGVGSDFRIL